MRLRSPRSLSACAVAVSALLLAGCGSTVQVSSQANGAGGLSGDGLSAPAAPAPFSDGTQTVTTPSGPTGGTVTSGGSQAQTPVTAPGAGSTAAPAAPSTAAATVIKGTKGPVKIGYFVLKDTGAAFSALGYKGLSSGNGRTQIAAAVAMVNAQGGIGGRQVVPVVFEADATQDTTAQLNQACAFWFQDNKVEAVVTIVYNDLINACTKRYHVPLISDSTASTSDSTLASNPMLVLPNHLSVEKAATTLVQGLVATSWLSPSKKPVIGLITYDLPAYSKVKPTIEAALAKAGLSLKTTFYMPSDDPSKGAPAGQSAALKFQSQGVTHVLGIDTGFGMSWFTLNAGNQGYYPKLGMTSLSLPSGFPLLFSDKQLEGSAVVGYAPALDTDPAKQPSVSPRTDACVKAMKAKGEDMGAVLTRLQAELLCDAGWFLHDTFTTGTLSAAALQSGLAGLTKGFQSSIAFKSDPRSRRAAAAAYRNAPFAASCHCFSYSGPLHTIS